MTDEEKEIFWNLEENLPRQVVNAVTDSARTLLEDAVETGTSDVYGDYSKTLRIRQGSDGTTAEATAEIRFRRLAECGSDRGFSVRLVGKVSDGTREYESEWLEVPAGYVGKGEIKDLVDLIENVGLTDWTYNRIEMFFEYLRDNLAEIKGEVA